MVSAVLLYGASPRMGITVRAVNGTARTGMRASQHHS